MRLLPRYGRIARSMRRDIITISMRSLLTFRNASRRHSLDLSTDDTEQSLAHLQNDRANAIILRVKATLFPVGFSGIYKIDVEH